MIIKIWYILMSSISFILFFDRPIVQIIYREFLRSCRILFPSEELAGDILIIGWKIYFSKYSSTLFYDGTISRQNYSTITISNKNCKSWVREKCKKQIICAVSTIWKYYSIQVLYFWKKQVFYWWRKNRKVAKTCFQFFLWLQLIDILIVGNLRRCRAERGFNLS